MTKKGAPEPTEHFGVLLEQGENGGQSVIYERDGEIHEGVINPLVEGKPLPPDGELVEVTAQGPLAVIKNYGKAGRATSQGPAMVNDAKYKAGWDRMFGNKKTESKNLN